MAGVLATEKLLRRIEWTNGILLVLVTGSAWRLYSAETALGVLLGGVIVSVSFQALKWQLKRAFQDPGNIPSKGRLFASYYLRFLGTLFLVFVVIYYGWANPIALVVGLSVVVVSITLVGGLEFLLMLTKKGES